MRRTGNFYQINHNKSVVRRSDLLNKALKLPLGPDGPSTTNLPNSIGRLLSLAICSRLNYLI